jgi:tRNA-dihydrouridine synthase
MDGVTDVAFRHIAAKYGKPAFTVTEFTSVEGIRAGATRLLDDFLYSPLEETVVAQLFGADPAAFFIGAVTASALGFDGIDINMGCPAKNVTSHGAGAALILDPERAREIVRQTRAGTEAWANGISLEEAGVPKNLALVIEERRNSMPQSRLERRELPVSLKTRIGYSAVIIEEWVKELVEVQPVAIALHGRTLKQLYTGFADWDAISKGASIIKESGIIAIGNGDVSSVDDARNKMEAYGLDGVLVGRAAQGNPWIFNSYEATLVEKLEIALEHSRYFSSHFPPQAFVRMRKHLLDYIKGFDGAKDIRVSLMRAGSLEDVESVILPLLSGARSQPLL